MKIGIKLEDKIINSIDMSTPERGNPGIGGTKYEQILLANNLKINHTVYLYHTNDTNIFPKGIISRCVDDEYDIPKKAYEDKVDILIFATIGMAEKWYKLLEEYKIKSIAWSHCYLNYFELCRLRKCSYIKRVVFVGHEQYSAYIADDIINKSTYIYNMYNSENHSKRDTLTGNKVIYLGALNRNKGFHVLAKAWKYIIKEVPDAQLLVLGSGKLYKREEILGKYKIATKEYENKFIKYIVDKKGQIVDSVNFLGIVGEEKDEYIKQCKVGVVNPTARTETFCISAIELQACGVPVCTKGKYGLLDTVLNKNTGAYSNTAKKLGKNVVKLLQNQELNEEFSNNAKLWAMKFSPSEIVPKWESLLNEIMEEQKVKYIEPTNKGNSIRIEIKKILRKIRIDKKLHFIPSFIIFEYIFQRMYRSFIKDVINFLKECKDNKIKKKGIEEL